MPDAQLVELLDSGTRRLVRSVDRMTDALTLTDANHMTRAVSIDLNLGPLTPQQLHALRSDPGAGGTPNTVWLPAARHSRSHLAPVVVRNAVGEQIRAAIHAHRFEKDGIRLHPGISIGVAAFPEDAPAALELFQRADEALYRAKQAGKDRVSR